MTFYRLLSAALLPICWVLVAVAAEAATKSASAAPGPAVTNSNGSNSSGSNSNGSNSSGSNSSGTNSSGTNSSGTNYTYNSHNPFDPSMIQRALYVLIGVTLIGVLYFLIRAVRMKKPIHRKKYGLLSNYDDSVEMEAVDSDEDDTLYEARSLRR